MYTHGHHDSVLRSHRQRTAENSAAYLLPELRAGLDLLDVGCGPGTITVDLAELVAPGRAFGVDASADVLDEARAFSAGRGVAVTFIAGDARQLEFGDASFDVVHAHQVLQHLADPVGALAEWARVCRPGGFVAARDADYGAMSWYPADPLLTRWRSLYTDVARANGGEPDAGRRLLSWARAAGFDDVTATGSLSVFAAPDARVWWSDTWAERVTSSALAGQLVERGLATRDELDGIAAAWRRWAAHDDAWFGVPHAEIVARR